jgi:hypothetical protein
MPCGKPTRTPPPINARRCRRGRTGEPGTIRETVRTARVRAAQECHSILQSLKGQRRHYNLLIRPGCRYRVPRHLLLVIRQHPSCSRTILRHWETGGQRVIATGQCWTRRQNVGPGRQRLENPPDQLVGIGSHFRAVGIAVAEWCLGPCRSSRDSSEGDQSAHTSRWLGGRELAEESHASGQYLQSEGRRTTASTESPLPLPLHRESFPG